MTLTNTGLEDLHDVRYMRDVDPDNTVDMYGSFTTINSIDATIAAGDSYAAVSARSFSGDYYYNLYGKQTTFVYFSTDKRCRVGYGAWYTSIYGTFTYDLPMSKGTNDVGDEEVYITFDVGTLKPGASATLTYYTALEVGAIEDVLATLQCKGALPTPLAARPRGQRLTPPPRRSCFGSAEGQVLPARLPDRRPVPRRLHLRGRPFPARSLSRRHLLPSLRLALAQDLPVRLLLPRGLVGAHLVPGRLLLPDLVGRALAVPRRQVLPGRRVPVRGLHLRLLRAAGHVHAAAVPQGLLLPRKHLRTRPLPPRHPVPRRRGAGRRPPLGAGRALPVLAVLGGLLLPQLHHHHLVPVRLLLPARLVGALPVPGGHLLPGPDHGAGDVPAGPVLPEARHVPPFRGAQGPPRPASRGRRSAGPRLVAPQHPVCCRCRGGCGGGRGGELGVIVRDGRRGRLASESLVRAGGGMGCLHDGGACLGVLLIK